MRRMTRRIFSLLLLAFGGLSLPADSSSPPPQEAVSFYQLLKLHKGASDTDVKRAYRKLSLEHHPDRVKARDGDAKKAEEIFQQINKAYQVLSNSRTRRLFDTYGDLFETQESYYDHIEKHSIDELYFYKPGVYLLHAPNLDPLLRNSKYSWIVGFYQSGCGSCERKVSFFSALGAAAQKTKKVRLAMVNCMVSHLCHFFGIHELGQILLFPPKQEGGDVWDSQEYTGPLSVQAIIDQASELQPVFLEEASSDRHVKEELRKLEPSRAVSGITAAWLVDYYRPSCPPCRRLRAELRRLSRTLSSQIRITLVNCDVGRCDVPHFPYLRLFVKHNNGLIRAHSLPHTTADHPGAATVQIVAFVFNSVLGLSPPPLPDEEKEKEDKTNMQREEL